MKPLVSLALEGDDVVVTGESLTVDRTARLFFLGSLGASERATGWRCPRRGGPLSALVVRINTFLETRGWPIQREALADDAVRGALERKANFERSRDAGLMFLQGRGSVRIEEVRKHLNEFGWDSSARNLRPHQESGLLHGLTTSSAANFSVPGAGKTATALAVAATHLSQGTIQMVIVVGPLSSFSPWEIETRAALPGRLKTRRIRGPAAKRQALYAAAGRHELLLISYATAAADKSALIDLCRRLQVMLIADESHRIKRFRGGTWAPALLEVARSARIRMILSGTPMPQSGRDLYTQFNVLWPTGDLTGPRDEFASRVEKNFPGLLTDLRPFMSRTPKAALGLPPYKIVRHEVPLVGTQAEIYELIEGFFRKHIASFETWAEKIDALRRGRPIRLLQAASNPDTLNRKDAYYRLPRIESAGASLMDRLAAYRGTELPAKTGFALQLLKGFQLRNEKVVCWSNFIPNLDQFSEEVSKIDIPCFQIDGRVAAGLEPFGGQTTDEEPETRERVIEDFLNSDGAAVLVANPASCSESISLHRACRTAIYLDRTYDCALFLQSIDRVHRLGLAADANVEIHLLKATLSAKSTIDELVDIALLEKESAMLTLLQGAELAAFDPTDDPASAAEGDEKDLERLLRYLLGESN